MMTVKIIPNDTNNPPGKLADAELHFTMPDPATFHASLRPTFEALAGLKLIGFGVWERRTGTDERVDAITGRVVATGRNVTFPSRQYSVNGERRSFSLLRPIADATAKDRICETILAAFAEYEEKAAVAT